MKRMNRDTNGYKTHDLLMSFNTQLWLYVHLQSGDSAIYREIGM